MNEADQVLMALSAALAGAVAAGGWTTTSASAARRWGILPDVPTRTRRDVGAWPLVGVAMAAGLLVTSVQPLVVVAAAVASIGVMRLTAASRHARDAAGRRRQVVEACEEIAGALRAGQPLAAALDGAASAWPELRRAAGAAHLGGDVPEALRSVATLPGATTMGRLAGAWQLCARTGAGLAFAVEQVLDTARAEQSTLLLVDSELASARATSRLVTALPVVVLLAAQGIGADPWHFLLATVPGGACLLVGVILTVAGLEWIERIARDAAGESGGG